MGKPYDTASGCWCESSPTDLRTGKPTHNLPNPQQKVLQMNRRQFLSLLPAAAVAGTAVAAAPKSLSLEEGLLSAWRIADPVFAFKRQPDGYLKIIDGPQHRALKFQSCTGQAPHYWSTTEDDLWEVDVALLSPSPLSQSDWWLQTEQGPMRLCPRSLRWFPYSPKTDAI